MPRTFDAVTEGRMHLWFELYIDGFALSNKKGIYMSFSNFDVLVKGFDATKFIVALLEPRDSSRTAMESIIKDIEPYKEGVVHYSVLHKVLCCCSYSSTPPI